MSPKRVDRSVFQIIRRHAGAPGTAEPLVRADCEEVEHASLVFLAVAGAKQRLLHRTTSENVSLPEVAGHAWQLSFAPNGFGYLAAVPVPGQQLDAFAAPPPMWVNDLFKMSLWRHAQGREGVAIQPSKAEAGGALKICWLQDLQAMPIAHYTRWQVHLPPRGPGDDPAHLCTMQCKAYKFQARRAGPCVFWGVSQMAAKMD